jgi:hypothetical protein
MTARLSALRTGRPLPSGRLLVLVFIRGLVDPRTTVRLEGLGQLQIAMTSSGIEPATFQLVAQCLNPTTLPRSTQDLIERHMNDDDLETICKK